MNIKDRELEDEERAVLANVVFDPDAWWAHVLSKDGSDGMAALDSSACLAAKVGRWKPDFDRDTQKRASQLADIEAAGLSGDPAYDADVFVTRIERDAHEAAKVARRAAASLG
tara:strand:+ start:2224 stop:2562 length:339 start_codon:yes stop_codon:yes gene_type:complete